VEAFLKKTDIAYHLNPRKKTRFGWYAISVFFKTLRHCEYSYKYGICNDKVMHQDYMTNDMMIKVE